jgi:hypothetical protein
MPTFCRHNHLVQNCPICAREQHVELRPVVSPGSARTGQGAPGGGSPRRPAGTAGTETAVRSAPTRPSGRSASGLTVRKLARGADDGYRSELVPGLKSGDDAQRLAQELAFGATRLQVLATDPPGLYAELAHAEPDLEERTWLAFLIAFLGPLDGERPFAEIERLRTSWSSGALPELGTAQTGPRGSSTPDRGERTIEAYRAWAARAGTQAAAFTGEAGWTPERRFARVFERLALPGLERGARFDLLVTLGRLGVYDLRAATLALGGSDPVTIAAKRLLGIGDTMLLQRRAADLASACDLPLEALDVGFYNWERGSRATLGLGPSASPDPAVLDATSSALGL